MHSCPPHVFIPGPDQVPLIEDLEQIFMRSWRESHLSEIRQYQQPQTPASQGRHYGIEVRRLRLSHNQMLHYILYHIERISFLSKVFTNILPGIFPVYYNNTFRIYFTSESWQRQEHNICHINEATSLNKTKRQITSHNKLVIVG